MAWGTTSHLSDGIGETEAAQSRRPDQVRMSPENGEYALGSAPTSCPELAPAAKALVASFWEF